VAEAPKPRELQMLANDPRWPTFRAWVEGRRKLAETALLKRGQEHHEMTRLAGEITAYDAVLRPVDDEQANSEPQE
jgi:hypothetical protein